MRGRSIRANPAGRRATDPFVNNVYVAWASVNVEPAAGAVVFNPDRIELVVGTPISSPSGNEFTMAFSGVRTVNTGGNFTAQIDTHPQLVINPGNTTNSNQTSVDPGQITVGWEDAGTADAANGFNPPLTLLMSNIVQPGNAYGFNGSTGAIAPAQTVTVNGTTMTVPVMTPFSNAVSVPNPALVNDLTVSLALVNQQTVQNLSVVLVAPNGASITLFLNQIDAAAKTNAGVGLPSGNAVGVYGFTTGTTGNPGTVVGTTFDDNATRNIYDPTAAVPPVNGNSAVDYVGFFRPEFGSLKNFLASVGSANINNTWMLQITNFSPTIATGVLNQAQLDKFSLQFSTRMTTPAGVTPSSIANEFEYVYGNNTAPFLTIVVIGSLTDTYPTAAPSTPNGVGPGLVLAQDNTLGPYSPYQGRIYAAFVGYFDAMISGPTNPTTNTDIFLVYSDNGGRSWSSPELVNNDQASTDGYSAANDSTANPNNQLTGRTQFQPAIAVNQSTGTVVVSWRDAHDDGGNARVATYITNSIDGGNTFGPQTYANPPKTAIDAITGQTEIIGPAADNESAANAQTDALFGYGNQMGLAVADGQLFPIWAGNFWGPGDINDSYLNGSIIAYPLNIWYQPMTIAAGPRIISSTMGPVVATTLTGSAIDLPQFLPPPTTPPNTPGTTTSVIPIAGDPSLKVSSVEVTLSLIYPTDGNLTISLTAPNGLSVILYGKPNDKGQSFTNTTFSDTGAKSISAGTAPYTGTFKPFQPLSLLNGIQAFGNWTLQVSGGIGPNGGILQSWSLSINGVASKPTAFEVTFDRPIDPIGAAATFLASDVQVFYHDTTNGSAFTPLLVTGIAPVVPPYYVTDPTQDGKDGYTNFLVTFNPDKMPNGMASGISNYTGTYSYVIAPDNGAATPVPISSPIWSYATVPVSQPVISPATDAHAKVSPNLTIPTWGPGGSGSQFDETTSTINLTGYNNQTISGLTVNLNITDPLTPPGLGNDGDLVIELTAPNGNTIILYEKPGDANQNFTNVTFSDRAGAIDLAGERALYQWDLSGQ